MARWVSSALAGTVRPSVAVARSAASAGAIRPAVRRGSLVRSWFMLISALLGQCRSDHGGLRGSAFGGVGVDCGGRRRCRLLAVVACHDALFLAEAEYADGLI